MLVKPGHIEKLCRMAEDNSLFMFSFKIKYSWIAILTLIPGVIAVYPGEAGHYERGMEDVTDYHHLRTSITISEQVSLSPNDYRYLHTLSPSLNADSTISAVTNS